MNKLLVLIKKTIAHELITGSFYIVLGSLLSSFLAFIFNLILARNLSYSDYGDYSSLLSLFTLATIPSGFLTAVIVRFATDYFTNKEEDKASYFYKHTLTIWSLLGIGIFVLFSIFTPLISGFLHIKEGLSLIFVSLAIAVTYSGVVNIAFLQSLTKFREMSFIAVLGSLVKLVVGFVLVIAGLRVVGATFAFFCMAGVSMLLAFLPLKKIIKRKITSPVKIHFSEIIKYALPTSVSILFLSSFISSDVLLVKHFFSSSSAGFYGGLSLVGKVIFYFTGPIPTVMFPLIVMRHSSGGKIHSLLGLSMFLVLIPSLFMTLIYFLFPQFIVGLFLGGREYQNIIPYLGYFGIFITIFSLLNVFVSFFLSVKKTRVVIPVAFFSILQMVLIVLFHKTFLEVIFDSIISILSLLIILLLYYLKSYGFYNVRK